MLKKVFLLPQFGTPYSWSERYFENIRTLEKYGWYWKIFTPNSYPSVGNIEIIPMSVEQFDGLVYKKTGTRSDNTLEKGVPRRVISDYYPAFGHIFEDYLTGVDFWGTTNWDIVFGRLDHFLPDELLSNCDIWSDDDNTINSAFTVYRNIRKVNLLYQKTPEWEDMFSMKRSLCGFDELYYCDTVQEAVLSKEIRFAYARYFGYHSYDRLVNQSPKPKLMQHSDGALLEIFEDERKDDPKLRNYAPFKGYFGREIMYYHFIKTKQWPLEVRS